MRSAKILLALALIIALVVSVGCSQTVVRITPINLGSENLTINNETGAGENNQAALPSDASLVGELSAPSIGQTATLANATEVTRFLQEYVDWSVNNNESTSYAHDVEIFAASNRQDGTVSYIEGLLRYNEASGAFEGSGRQYFNKMRWSPETLQSPSQEAAPAVQYPFDPTRIEDVDVSLDFFSGTATISHVSSGASETVSLQPADGILYGSTSSATPSMYVISLKAHRTPI